MKALRLKARRELELAEVPEPVRGEGEILVAPRAVGVCGSDAHYYREGGIGGELCTYPQSIGHECAGEVVACEPASEFRPGDRVAVEPGSPCGTCEHCVSGYHNRCPFVRFLGSPGMPGALQERLSLPPSQLARIPQTMRFPEATLLEPLGVALHAVTLARLRPTESVVIFGSGPIGLLLLAVARACGAGPVIVMDKLRTRLDVASRRYGASHTVDVNDTDPVEAVREITGGRGADAVFEAAGSARTIGWSLESARIGGRVMIVGIPDEDRVTVNPHTMRRKELRLINVRRSNRTLARSVAMVSQALVTLEGIVSHTYTLEQAPRAFDVVSGYRDGVIKAVIELN